MKYFYWWKIIVCILNVLPLYILSRCDLIHKISLHLLHSLLNVDVGRSQVQFYAIVFLLLKGWLQYVLSVEGLGSSSSPKWKNMYTFIERYYYCYCKQDTSCWKETMINATGFALRKHREVYTYWSLSHVTRKKLPEGTWKRDMEFQIYPTLLVMYWEL